MPAPVIFTTGYEGAVQDELLDRLASAGARVLLDIRAVPQSRKPGFSKRLLAASAEARGIRYVHLQALGTPKPGREAARAGHAAEMERIFAAHMATEPAQAALAARARYRRLGARLPALFRARSTLLPSPHRRRHALGCNRPGCRAFVRA
ncbi:MAG: DUF488 domain-containing protein [Rhodospirillales bacterium]